MHVVRRALIMSLFANASLTHAPCPECPARILLRPGCAQEEHANQENVEHGSLSVRLATFGSSLFLFPLSVHLAPFCIWCVTFFDIVAYFGSSGLGVGLRPTLLAAMALERPRLCEEPDPGTCNALHIHLVEYACEELWSLAADSDDENAATYDEQAEQLMCAGGTPCNRDLFEAEGQDACPDL